MTHICVGKTTIIGSDNGLSPDRRQAIIWTNAWLLLIGPLGTNFSEILIENRTFLFKKMRLKVFSAKRRPFCLGLNVLTHLTLVLHIWISKLDQWLVTFSVPSHYLNQCCVIVNYTLRNNFHEIFNQNTEIFIHENVLEIAVCKRQPFCPEGDELIFDNWQWGGRGQETLCSSICMSIAISQGDITIQESNVSVT